MNARGWTRLKSRNARVRKSDRVWSELSETLSGVSVTGKERERAPVHIDNDIQTQITLMM